MASRYKVGGREHSHLFKHDTLLAGIAAVVILTLSFVDNVFVHAMHMDVSWLITVCEKVLDGQQLNVDIRETNPPFSIYMYLPLVALARSLGSSPETWVIVGTYCWLALCISCAIGIIRSTHLFPARTIIWFVPTALALYLLALPATFAQRDLVAALSALPMVLVATARLRTEDEARLGSTWLVVAGLLAAITMAIKPHYALAFAFPYIFVAWARRDWRVLFRPEILVAGVAVILTWSLMVATDPLYFSELAPVLMDVYVANRLSMYDQALGFGALGIILILLNARFSQNARPENRQMPVLMADAGFLVSFFVMGKGWDYQALPFIVFGCLGLMLSVFATAGAHSGQRDRTGQIILSGFVIGMAWLSITNAERGEPRRELVAALQSRSIKTVNVIGNLLGLGHPTSRMIGADWTDRDGYDWQGAMALKRLATGSLGADLRNRLTGYVDDAVKQKIDALTRRQPDLLIVDRDDVAWLGRLMEVPEFARRFDQYQVIAQAGSFDYMISPRIAALSAQPKLTAADAP